MNATATKYLANGMGWLSRLELSLLGSEKTWNEVPQVYRDQSALSLFWTKKWIAFSPYKNLAHHAFE